MSAFGGKADIAIDGNMSAYDPEQLFGWDTRGKKKPNEPVGGFGVPLFCKLLIRLRWRSPLGTAKKVLQL